MKTKVCTKCKIEKPMKEFHNCKNYKDGKCYWCVYCVSKNKTKYNTHVIKHNKVCGKCKINKPINKYSKDNNRKDGHDCYCKDCRKMYLIKLKTENIDKYNKLLCKRKIYLKSYKNYSRDYFNIKMKEFRDRNPEKFHAYNSTKRTTIKGKHRHHWSYHKSHIKNVILLTPQEHKRLHAFMKYDKDSKMYRTLEGKLLDTKRKHLLYAKKVFKNYYY